MAVSRVAPRTESIPGEDVNRQSALRRFCTILQQKLFDCIPQIISHVANFHEEIKKHLSEMDKLNEQITEVDYELRMKLSDFARDISNIRDYYNLIIDSTESIIKYGSKNIPYIIKLLDKNSYDEATKEIVSLLYGFKQLIERVEKDINTMNENAKPEEVREKIKQIISECKSQLGDLKNADEMQAVCHDRVFRLGSTTLVYMTGGAAAVGCVISCMPKDWSAATEIVQSTGSGVFSFVTDSVLKGLGSVMNAANLSKELRKMTESKVKEICECLLKFFDQINLFQSNIASITTANTGLKGDMTYIEDEVSCDQDATVSGWGYQRVILEKILDKCRINLPSCIARSKDDNVRCNDVLSVSSTLTDNHS